MLVIFVLTLVALLGIAALVVDIGSAYGEKRNLQKAADAAALAGAAQLELASDSCDATCVRAAVKTNAQRYSAQNGGPAELNGGTGTDPAQCQSPLDKNCYRWPYPDASAPDGYRKVEVRLGKTSATFFGGILGVGAGFLQPKARAVALASPVEVPSGGPGIAFARSSSCFTSTHANADTLEGAGSIFVNKAGNTFIGGMAGNGSFSVGDHDDGIQGGVRQVFPFVGAGKKDGGDVTPGECWYQGQARVNVSDGPEGYPKPFPVTPPTWNSCLAVSAAIPSTQILPSGDLDDIPHTSGVYCYEGKIKINFEGKTTPDGGIAFVAAGPTGRIAFAGAHNNTLIGYCIPLTNPLDPDDDSLPEDERCPDGQRRLLFYAAKADTNAVQIQSHGLTLKGDIFAPNGQIHLSGNDTGSINIFFQAHVVYLDGSGADLTGYGPPLGSTIDGVEVGLDE